MHTPVFSLFCAGRSFISFSLPIISIATYWIFTWFFHSYPIFYLWIYNSFLFFITLVTDVFVAERNLCYHFVLLLITCNESSGIAVYILFALLLRMTIQRLDLPVCFCIQSASTWYSAGFSRQTEPIECTWRQRFILRNLLTWLWRLTAVGTLDTQESRCV